LITPEHFESFIDAFTKELNWLTADRSGDKEVIENRLTMINNQLEKAVDAILNGADAVTLNTRMKEPEGEKAELQVQLLATGTEPRMLLHPNMSRLVAKLSEALTSDPTNREAFEAIRSLLDKVTLHPTDEGFDMDIEGDLANILPVSSEGKVKPTIDIHSLGNSLERASWDRYGDTGSNQESAAGNNTHESDTAKPSGHLIEGF
jgi:hypothetical protein